ncbi:acyl-CoA thioesterase [Planococcus lenghuensis]|uniref:Thioesterase n=1 Tax=Planococcus lenghuensis TaxID=2213202 RepID=A0A1Q2L0X9_9BACL|nr:acyl-CoA thioesterase [Planococcus lenghuensis]AQQ54073.1 thioesterase [Planococcus lenghuensis]
MKQLPETTIYVRFCETDAGGHVSNTSYFFYMEEARSKFFEAIGFRGRGSRENMRFIMAATGCNFIAQAYSSQLLTVTTSVDRIGTKSFSLRHEIRDTETGTPIASGHATAVCFDFINQVSQPVPDTLRGMLEEFLVPA